MKAVIQRVSRASVLVDGKVVGSIGASETGAAGDEGLVVLLGVTHGDGRDQIAWLARKVRDVRILRGERSAADAQAPILVVSQFTLFGDARKGRRPTWAAAAPGSVSEPVYEAFCDELERLGSRVERGVFGADMSLELVNDGPVTLIMDTNA